MVERSHLVACEDSATKDKELNRILTISGSFLFMLLLVVRAQKM